MSESVERIEALFNRALEFRPDERAAFLAGACAHEPGLLVRLQALLQAHESGEEILSEQPKNPDRAPLAAERPGDRIGPYKLLEQIGEGGCGVVYMAEQAEPVRRRVALKVLKLGMDTKRVIARFEAERQALALMDHPNIARVLDAGTTPTGRPYFVMELVRGVKITDYCERNRLGPPQRLELMMQVCRAIQHAHQKGIIHRDIKPSNVLVTVHDGVPVPKVIDFGIAKATEGRLTDQTLFTSFEQFIGTPAYMSPEQAEVKGLDVDTRTDIYSLGVLLYELLTGRTPFDAEELLTAGLDAMRRTICEKEPLRPSTRLTLELASAGVVKPKKPVHPERSPNGETQSTDAPSADCLLQKKDLIRLLRGDLDWIVMKCLEKDRARRYETANGLAMDLQRHLNGEPVVARPPSSLYRLQKLVQRNRLTFAAAAAVALALVLGIIASTWEAVQARQAERAQARAHLDADMARAGEARQRGAAEQHLYEALLGEARAKQLSGSAGQRFESLDAIAKAAAIRSSTELSDAAVAALSLVDLREQKSWRLPSHWAAENVCFDERFGLYAYRTGSGVSVRQLADDQEVAALAVTDTMEDADGLLLRRFDPQGRYLAASCILRDGSSHARVWDLTRQGALVLDAESTAQPDFSPDGRAVALAEHEDTVSVKEIESGKELKRFPSGRVDLLRFNPEGTSLAGLEFGSTNARVWELSSGRVSTTLVSSGKLSALAWSRDGRRLATGRIDGQIELWDAPSGRLQKKLEGHGRRVARLAFSHQDELLASGSWDHTLRLWDAAGGQQLVVYRTPDTELFFSPDDRTLACAIAGEVVQLLEVAHSTGYQHLPGNFEPNEWRIGGYSPDGRWLLAASTTGIGIWDMGAGKQLGMFQALGCRGAVFATNGGLSIIGSTGTGLYRWPLSIQPTTRGSFLRAGAPETLAAGDAFGAVALPVDGKKVVAASATPGQEALLLDVATPANARRLRGVPGPGFVAMDSNGRWAAKGLWKEKGVNIYEAATAQLVSELPVKHTAFLAFSPNNQWLATADMMELKLWQTGSWKPCPASVPGDRVSEVNPVAFSPDGQLLAAAHGSYYEIKLVRVPTLEPVATLRTPTLAPITSLCFSPDGTKLAALEWSGRLAMWDLGLLRRELRKLGLDWNCPPLPKEAETPPPGPAVLDLDAGPFSKRELAEGIPARDPATVANLVDLTDWYNTPLNRTWCGAKTNENNLAELRPGVQTLADIQFDVRGIIQLGVSGANGLDYPSRLDGIPLNQRCRRLHFLHAAINVLQARPGEVLGTYILHYVDGREIDLPLAVGKELADWWSQPDQTFPGLRIAWTGSNPTARASGHSVRLFRMTWENPNPEVPLKELDFVSVKEGPGQPFLLAITAEH